MNTSKNPVRAAQPNLRDAQRAFTHTRIRDSARDLFHANGYHVTTIDQIVAAAGASRPTFYLHFSDKEEILREVIADYLPRAIGQLESFPGSSPSLARIGAWMTQWLAFVEREKASIVLLGEIGSTASVMPVYLREAIDALIEALARRIPALLDGRKPNAIGRETRIRLELLIMELTWVGRIAMQAKGMPFAEAAITVVSRLLRDFISEPKWD
jgi:AcrR family transcriptional regulator